MFKVTKNFKDHLDGNKLYKVGDDYVPIQEIWTKHLIDNGFIQKVEIKKDKKGFFSKVDNEDVAEKQE